jgi:hypothetical protein
MAPEVTKDQEGRRAVHPPAMTDEEIERRLADIQGTVGAGRPYRATALPASPCQRPTGTSGPRDPERLMIHSNAPEPTSER